MTERRTLLALLLLVATFAFYIWGKRSNPGPGEPKPPEKTEAEERSKAQPFPAAESLKPAGQPSP